MAFLLAAGLVAFLPQEAQAQTAPVLISEGLRGAGEGVYITELKLPTFIGNMIRTILAATGIVFLVITVWAGIIYMTASGDDTKIKKAKGMITSSVIGLIIIVGAYAITSYVVGAISTAATRTAPTEAAPD